MQPIDAERLLHRVLKKPDKPTLLAVGGMEGDGLPLRDHLLLATALFEGVGVLGPDDDILGLLDRRLDIIARSTADTPILHDHPARYEFWWLSVVAATTLDSEPSLLDRSRRVAELGMHQLENLLSSEDTDSLYYGIVSISCLLIFDNTTTTLVDDVMRGLHRLLLTGALDVRVIVYEELLEVRPTTIVDRVCEELRALAFVGRFDEDEVALLDVVERFPQPEFLQPLEFLVGAVDVADDRRLAGSALAVNRNVWSLD